MTTKSVSVAAIKEGTVIDHITAGNALKIVGLLDLTKEQRKVTVGLNLRCGFMPKKDLIKVEGYSLTREESFTVAIFAPNATINLIQDYEVKEKYKVEAPKTIEGILSCPNPNCITLHERMNSFFFVTSHGKDLELVCRYCRQCYRHTEMNEYPQ